MSGFSHDLAGGNGNLVITSFQSPGYVAGVSGWQVTITGDAEFNNIIARGVIDATEFSATVTVSAGPYAGAYTIETGELTDSGGNQLAVIQWLNGTSPASVPPYIAAVTGPGAGGLMSVHSGVEDGSDAEAAIWCESAEASGFSAPLVLFDTEVFQPFGGSGPLLYIGADGGIAVDDWHNITLDSGWTAGAQAPQYRALPDGNIEVRGQATHAGTTSATNINNSHPIPSGYWPAVERIYRPPIAGDTAGTVQIGTNGVFAMRASGFTATQVFMDGEYSL